MKVKFYYGLSGCLKGTTIQVQEAGASVMNSSIKLWKYYQSGLFQGLLEDNDLVYGILHLTRLKEFLDREKGGSLVVERGISDCLFYRTHNDEYCRFHEDSGLITRAVGEELSLIPPEYDLEKILLVQKDYSFIRDVVLKDPYRNKTFHGDLRVYVELQEKYVDWTMTYNKIDKVIEIDNAKTYIEDVLGIDYLK